MRPAPRSIVAMVGVVCRDDKVLVMRRADDGRWEAPAGAMERDEAPQACVEREVLDETGIVAKAVDVVAVYKNMVHPDRPVSIVWRCRCVAGEARATDEATAVEWLGRKQILERLRPAYAARVLSALDYDGSVEVRVHDGDTFLD
jgi:8-oxo-dGTP diphosphatase